ncbi:DUF4383 domain-containing protein [Arthrobacter crystallopoietes]|uniref:DUF4383 domain-containing protein n=1 Tax=Crystallibacter crystallopoietes TaxID=37928 RepID=UPI001111071C|nr:DUF4383 domain-containing protein [Arthrobacter crystallopoietes]
MTTSDQTSIREGKRTSVQTVTLAVGAVFLLVGILGFVPGITSGVDQLTFAGHQSGAMLLGLFQVSILHNIVHLLFGVVGLALSRSWSGSRSYLIWGGAIYLVLWIYGLVIGHESPANFVPLNTADNWLHFVLGVAMLGLGVLLGRGHTATKA